MASAARQRKQFLNRMVVASTHEGGAIAEEADEMGSAYLATLAKLDRFNKGSKKLTQINSHKLEWMEEHRRLEGQHKKLDDDLNGSLRSLGALLAGDDQGGATTQERAQGTSGGDGGGAVAALHEAHVAFGERRALVADVSRRFRELQGAQAQFKALSSLTAPPKPKPPPGKLKSALKTSSSSSHRSATMTDGGGGEKEDAPYTEAKVREFGSNVAHYLLESRRWNEACAERLDATEAGLSEDLAAARRAVARAIAGDSAYGVLSGGGSGGGVGSGGGGGMGGPGGSGGIEAVAEAEVRKMLALLGELDVTAAAPHAQMTTPTKQPRGSGISDDENVDPADAAAAAATMSMSMSMSLSRRPSFGGPSKRGEIWRDLEGLGSSAATVAATPAASEVAAPAFPPQAPTRRPTDVPAEIISSASPGGACALLVVGGGSEPPFERAQGTAEAEAEVAEVAEIDLEVLLARAEVADRVWAMVRRREEGGALADADCAESCRAAVRGSAAVAASVALRVAAVRSLFAHVHGGAGGGSLVAAAASATASATAASVTSPADAEVAKDGTDYEVGGGGGGGDGGSSADCANATADTPSAGTPAAAALRDEALAEAAAVEAAAEAAVEEAANGAEGRGGWGRREHAQFETTYKSLQAGLGRSRERALDRLALTMGQDSDNGNGIDEEEGEEGGSAWCRTRAELERHAAWCDATALRRTRRAEASDAYRRQQGECLAWARGRLDEARGAARDRVARLQAAEATASRAAELRRRLALLRPGRDAADLDAATKASAAAKAEAEALEAAVALEAARAVKRRAAVGKFHEDQALARAQRLKDDQAEALAAEHLRRARLESNGGRVEFRSDRRKAKLDSVEQLRWAAQVNTLKHHFELINLLLPRRSWVSFFFLKNDVANSILHTSTTTNHNP